MMASLVVDETITDADRYEDFNTLDEKSRYLTDDEFVAIFKKHKWDINLEFLRNKTGDWTAFGIDFKDEYVSSYHLSFNRYTSLSCIHGRR